MHKKPLGPLRSGGWVQKLIFRAYQAAHEALHKDDVVVLFDDASVQGSPRTWSKEGRCAPHARDTLATQSS
jgi:hypothetical protein